VVLPFGSIVGRQRATLLALFVAREGHIPSGAGFAPCPCRGRLRDAGRRLSEMQKQFYQRNLMVGGVCVSRTGLKELFLYIHTPVLFDDSRWKTRRSLDSLASPRLHPGRLA